MYAHACTLLSLCVLFALASRSQFARARRQCLYSANVVETPAFSNQLTMAHFTHIVRATVYVGKLQTTLYMYKRHGTMHHNVIVRAIGTMRGQACNRVAILPTCDNYHSTTFLP